MAAPGLKTVNEEVPVSRFRKYALIGATVLVVLIGAAAVAYHFAVAALKQHIVDALGPNGEIAALRVSTTAVEIDGLRVRAPSMPGWPARDVLRAEHVRVEPDLRSLLSDAIIIRRVNIEGAYLPILRNEKGLVLLPGMVGEPKRDAHDKQAEGGKPKSTKTVKLSTIELTDSRIDFYDATIRRPPHLIPLSEINAELDDLVLPALDAQSLLTLDAVVIRGSERGKVSLKGVLDIASKDSTLHLRLRDMPLATLEPYLVKAANTHVQRGTLDLDLDSKIAQRKLTAPGSITLANMELSGGNEFAGLGRQAALALLKDKRDRIELQFTLEGNLDDPKFSLNEQFLVRVGNALAESLGVSVETLGKGLGSVGEGLGETVKKLLGK